MRIIFISDTHSNHRRFDIPDGDVLAHTGDFTKGGNRREIVDFASWLRDQPHKNKIVIAGNHDFGMQRSPEAFEQLFQKPGVRYLRDSGVCIDGVHFWGSPWQPEYFDWAFNLPRRGPELHEFWEMIPERTNVLLTHGPPNGILDSTFDGRLVGCEILKRRIGELPNLKVHAFGHIHEGYGRVRDIRGREFVNSAMVGHRSEGAIIVDI